ncbi:MAG: Alpha,alpha-trehalose-phosphate synthase [UDP-forming] [uncultured Gemmatimonadaceae bacterium]|uniref:Alpha,alpha-trehalose-phosphate synthase [UDP-forming] n=1 Tax=uncultured Gemmatimonadaceae bacterium TaxID=246130 RepID=A0A6J4LG85_9BACT|nr:MAG: Alpha,alpha-trehalose-phosphate synthase [UDP-forming] [uncultured Gemmatimonadaceae bacterium]
MPQQPHGQTSDETKADGEHDLARHLRGRTLILLSNREPYEHVRARDGAVKVNKPAGGLVSALDPTMQRTRGVWVAWGSGDADRENADEGGCVAVPPESPAYTLRRVWLDEDDVEGYYLGFANSCLWPLCHLLVQHFSYRAEYWRRYEAVNARFADAVAEQARATKGEAVVWVQDYHFALAPAMIRERAPGTFVHQFWHIPFPPPEILRFLPTSVYQGVMRGMLGNDLIEFHTERYAANFLACVRDMVPGAQVRGEDNTIAFEGRTIQVGAFPISIDARAYQALAESPTGERGARELRARHAVGGRQLGVSVDRIDYTKGIPERLRAIDLFWTVHPEFCERVTIVVVATPSRSDIPAYSALETEVVDTVTEINARHGTPGWTPVELIHENVGATELAGIYRAGDVCLVSSLQDGMNLVAKEFIACQVDQPGVLVLSRFAGASEEIDGALLINPFDVDGFVAGMHKAFTMSESDRRRRMDAMREHLFSATIFDWLDSILARVGTLAARS